MYQPFPKAKFETLERKWWFQELAEHIRPQMESSPYITDLDKAASLPVEVRAIYFLWEFYSHVGGNGIEVYLLELHGYHAPYAHEALKLVGASELIERLEAAIPHAIASGVAEFTAGSNMAWYRQFSPNSQYPTLQSVDADIYELANDDICGKCNDFIESHLKVFVA